ncbi:uncharacterized protein LOC116841100 [Odontomachus brunneus]|uniref:uncharacterized protein LOC116841100 n=1 Tax=Odontomachus brunneus TaxID=486640 RepID=UPI0013F1EE3C|nr:uncharacterized protein LOC116841100 [Odontomachus brunneus]
MQHHTQRNMASFFVFVLSCFLFFLCPIGIAEAQTVPPICLGLGAFQIYDGTCKNYYICVNDGEKIVPVVLACATTAVFDPVLSRCVTGTTCPQTTTPVTCTEYGTFEIYDGTCKNYYICINDGMNLVAVILSCATTAIFDPTLGRCLPGAMCLQTTTTTTTTLAPPTTAAPCMRYGRFPIPDVNCKKYYLCYWDGIRYAIMGNLTCPNTLVFDPTSEKCVLPQQYICLGIVG